MNNKFFLIILILLIICGCKSKNDEYILKIGTGDENGYYYQYGEKLAQLIQQKESKIKCVVRSTTGSNGNFRLVASDFLDMALVQDDIVAERLKSEQFVSGKASGFHIINGLFSETLHLVVNEDSDIYSIYDLQGKNVSVGSDMSGTEFTVCHILDSIGISKNNFTPFYFSFEQSCEALKENKIDAFFILSSYPVNVIAKLSEEKKIRCVGIDKSILRFFQEKYDLIPTTIPVGSYNGQNSDIQTVGVKTDLIISDKVPQNVEKTIIDILEKQNGVVVNHAQNNISIETPSPRVIFTFDMYLTLVIGVVALFIGKFLRLKIKFFESFCIPAPVIGGLIIAILSFILYQCNIVELHFDETIKNICMMMFFTTVGFGANIKMLAKGGIGLFVFLIAIIVLIFCQNGLAIGISKLLNVSPWVGMCAGSIPMIGGHGTSGAFGGILEDMGMVGATSLCTAAATFGLIFGSLIGGPIGHSLIKRNNLIKTAVPVAKIVSKKKDESSVLGLFSTAAIQIAVAMGIGSVVSWFLSKTGMTFPGYIGAMIVAATMRNIAEYSGKLTIPMKEIDEIGSISLSIFLGIAMVCLKLWELIGLALPLLILLVCQVVLMTLFAYFVVYNVMGRNYDAAILSAGACGFGLGATPNAMVNMQALTDKYVPSVKAYLIVPIVGGMFVDFFNSLIITFFINIL